MQLTIVATVRFWAINNSAPLWDQWRWLLMIRLLQMSPSTWWQIVAHSVSAPVGASNSAGAACSHRLEDCFQLLRCTPVYCRLEHCNNNPDWGAARLQQSASILLLLLHLLQSVIVRPQKALSTTLILLSCLSHFAGFFHLFLWFCLYATTGNFTELHGQFTSGTSSAFCCSAFCTILVAFAHACLWKGVLCFLHLYTWNPKNVLFTSVRFVGASVVQQTRV